MNMQLKYQGFFYRYRTPWQGFSGLMLMLAASSVLADITVHTGTDEQARLPYWEIKNQAMMLRLVQRLPDQTRGYFQARGFTPEQSELIAQSCVFQTIFKNISGTKSNNQLGYDLQEWTVHFKDKKQKMKMREQWKPVWNKLEVSHSAQVAFEWSLLPTQQTYNAGDYNWGMSIFNLKPGSKFDLQVSWNQFGKKQNYLIRNIECAPDIHPDPSSREFGK